MTSPYRERNAVGFRTSTPRSPAPSVVPAGNVNVIPLVNFIPERSSGVAPVFATSTYSKSSFVNGLPTGGWLGLYISSVTRSGGGVAGKKVVSSSALQFVPLRYRASTRLPPASDSGPV